MTAPLPILRRFSACDPAMTWVEAHAHMTPAELWRACPDGSWLLWIAARLYVDRRYVVAAACACAQGVLNLVPAGEERPRIAVETAIRWTQGLATLDEVRSAAYAAYTAYADYTAYAAYTAYADYTAYAAASAAYADSAPSAYTAYAAASAAYAAYAAAAASASDSAAYAARSRALRLAARRVRKVIPWRLVEAALTRQHDVGTVG
jgi:hypothetical protein